MKREQVIQELKREERRIFEATVSRKLEPSERHHIYNAASSRYRALKKALDCFDSLDVEVGDEGRCSILLPPGVSVHADSNLLSGDQR